MSLANCPACGRVVSILREGELCNHGPGPGGEFACPGSGDPAFVAAADHLHVEAIPQAHEPRLLTARTPRRSARRS
jgi:hypothetical protein